MLGGASPGQAFWLKHFGRTDLWKLTEPFPPTKSTKGQVNSRFLSCFLQHSFCHIILFHRDFPVGL